MKENFKKKNSEIVKLAGELLEILENRGFSEGQVIHVLDLCLEAYELELAGELYAKEHTKNELEKRGINNFDNKQHYEALDPLFDVLEGHDLELEDRLRIVSLAHNTAWGYSSCLGAAEVSITLQRIEKLADLEIDKLRAVVPVFLKKAAEIIHVPLNSADHMFLRDALQKAQVNENEDIDKVIYPLGYVMERLASALQEQPEYSNFAEFEQLAILRVALFAKAVLRKWLSDDSQLEDNDRLWSMGHGVNKSLMDLFRIGVYAGAVDTVSGLPTDWMRDFFHGEKSGLPTKKRHASRKKDMEELLADSLEIADRLWQDGDDLRHNKMADYLLEQFPELQEQIIEVMNQKGKKGPDYSRKKLIEALRPIALKYDKLYDKAAHKKK